MTLPPIHPPLLCLTLLPHLSLTPLPEAAFPEAQISPPSYLPLQLPQVPATHIRIIVHRRDQVLHQGLQGPGSEASILKNEVLGAAAGSTSSLPHARLPLSVTVGSKDAGEDHRCLGHSFLGKKNKGVRYVPGGLQSVCTKRLTKSSKVKSLGSSVVPQTLQLR